jgi:uncharacterized protein YjbJ (UPF0337 family)
MNKEIVEGNWMQLKGLAQRQWGWVTNNSFLYIEGERNYRTGELLEACGIARDDARRRARRGMSGQRA